MDNLAIYARSFRFLLISFFCLVLFLSSTINQAYAIAYEGIRSVEWDRSSDQCRSNDNHVDGPASDVHGIGFSPFVNNRDMEWELDNPVCIGIIVGFGTATMIAALAADKMCGTPPNPTRLMNIAQMIPLVGNGAKCAAYTSAAAAATSAQASCIAANVGNAAACAPLTVTMELADSQMTKCCGAYAVQLSAYVAQLAAVATIYGISNQTYKRARVCGHDWQIWTTTDNNGNVITNTNGDPMESRGNYINVNDRSYAGCLTSLFTGNDSCNYGNHQTVLTNRYYREYIFGGQEYVDSGSGACGLPSSWTDAMSDKFLGYHGGNQRYYMRGPGLASNYACNRYLLGGSNDATVQAAYNCCVNRSKTTICIEYAPLGTSVTRDTSTFCTASSNCSLSSVTFQAYQSKSSSNYICAKTYSVCPYNHLLAGGTELEDYSNPNAPGVRQNFCQYMNHCVKIPQTPYVAVSNLNGAFISQACKDLKGSSQNTYIYNANLISTVSGRNFSAPIAECFKETMENLMLNQAGSSVCANSDEVADQNGVCASGNYATQEGGQLPGQSFFVKLQGLLQTAIKMCLVLSVMFFGTRILLGLGEIKRKDLILYIVKIGLVAYFAIGDAWQSTFINGVMSSATYLANVTTIIDPGLTEPSMQDGCQFPKFNYKDLNDTNSANFAYPPGKEYLRVWDTLDCKLTRALGFGPAVSVPNLVMMILAGFFTGPLGIVFVVASLIFAFFLIFLIVRAIHIFLISTIAITLLIYVSPITITASLFDRTKSIFDNWWKQLLGLVLQPMVLFAYIGIFVTIFDSVMIGSDVTFSGDGINAPKQIICPSDSTSIYCIFDDLQITTNNSLAVIGIGLPVLVLKGDLLKTVVALFQAALLMFIFTQFMNKIEEVAVSLVGGPYHGAGWGSVEAMTKKTFGALNAVSERGMRAAKKYGGKAAGAATQAIGKFGDKGKNIAGANDGQTKSDQAKPSDAPMADRSVIRDSAKSSADDNSGQSL